jgi:hypothetical protein
MTSSALPQTKSSCTESEVMTCDAPVFVSINMQADIGFITSSSLGQLNAFSLHPFLFSAMVEATSFTLDRSINFTKVPLGGSHKEHPRATP